MARVQPEETLFFMDSPPSWWCVAGALTALSLVPLGQLHPVFGVAGGLFAVVVALAARGRTNGACRRVAVLAVLLVLIGAVGVPFALWAVVVLLYAGSRRASLLVPEQGWLPVGSTSRATWQLAAVGLLTASGALVVWALTTTQYGAATVQLARTVRDTPIALVVAGVAVFVVVNSLVEEIAFRGIVWEAARCAMPPSLAVVAQAVPFATLHVSGFPAGAIGVGLAFVYGLFLGTIRHLSNGLRAPVVIHMAADATIAILVLTVVVPLTQP